MPFLHPAHLPVIRPGAQNCVAARAGDLGHPGRTNTRHHPPDAPGRPGHFAAGNPAACAQSRAGPSSSTAAATHTATVPSTAAGRASAAPSGGHPQSSTTSSSAPGRSDRRSQRRPQTSHHSCGQQRNATCARHRSCACGPGTRCTAHAHPCQRQRCPMRQTRLPQRLPAHGRRRHREPALSGGGRWQSDPVRDRKKLGLQTSG
jgi:hypothetical protein